LPVSETQNKKARHPAVMSLHLRMLGDLKSRILSGDYPPGFRLPTEMELCQQYDCSRMTASKVLSELAKSGLIERRKRAGSFVLRPHSQSAVLEIHDVRTEVEATGREYGYRLLDRQVRLSDQREHAWLDSQSKPRVLTLEAIHLAAGQPFCLEQRTLNLEAVPEAEDADFERIAPSAWLLERIPWTSAEHAILAEGAGSDIAEYLGIASGQACLIVQRKTWNSDRPVTIVRLTYAGDTHSLVARFSPNQ
jgi:GntR family histidine utilization transcriptional repressor